MILGVIIDRSQPQLVPAKVILVGEAIFCLR